MKLKLENGTTIKDPDDAAIARALESLDAGGSGFAILAQSDMVYVQAALAEGQSLFLEYQDESLERHFQAESLLTVRAAIDLFQRYARGDPSWVQACSWKKMKL